MYYTKEPEFEGNIAFIKVDNLGIARCIAIEGYAGDMMYGRNDTLETLKARYNVLIDIRLD